MHFRVSGRRSQSYIIDYFGSSNYENWDFITSHGTYSSFDINTYVMPHESFAWHFGFYLRFNSRGWNTATVYTSWDNAVRDLEPITNGNRFLNMGFRTAITTKIMKTDLNLTICVNPFPDGVNFGMPDVPLGFNFTISRKFSYEK